MPSQTPSRLTSNSRFRSMWNRRDGQLLDSIHQFRKRLEPSSRSDLAQQFHQIQLEAQSCSTSLNHEHLVQAFALGMEALRRTSGLMAYDVQILAGLAMARGSVAEMQTGEGKTLTTLFPITAFALHGHGVHVATVSDYLAHRDFEFLKPALNLIGISSSLSSSGLSADEKRSAYAADVTFATGYELGFDFLRDQIAARSENQPRLGSQLRRDLFHDDLPGSTQTQRGYAAAIIDEIDSVFIDEATTPLVLSAGSLGSKVDPSVYRLAKSVAEQLQRDLDFHLDTSEKSVTLTERGVESSHQLLSQAESPLAHLQLLRPWRQCIDSALRAMHLMTRDINYVIRDNTVEIVDEYTGRIFSDRNWRDGLHQAVEAKEDVTITEERKTIAKISRQRYFQRYDTLCGMTGTADGHQKELRQCYRLPVVIIPRRKPLLRIECPTRYFKSQADKLKAIIADTTERNTTGQPILIGTRTIQQSIAVSEQLTLRKIAHQVLNGVQDKTEAELIADAGSLGSLTVATNMAGRGTDIKLGPGAVEAGGLHVIGFERNSSLRIDRQLLGRAGRQGDPGSGQFFVSAEDDLLTRFDPRLAKQLQKISRSDGTRSQRFDRRIRQVQANAELASYRMRQGVMREELWLDKIKKLAG